MSYSRSYRSGHTSAPKDLDHHVGIDDLAEVWKIVFGAYNEDPSPAKGGRLASLLSACLASLDVSLAFEPSTLPLSSILAAAIS